MGNGSGGARKAVGNARRRYDTHELPTPGARSGTGAEFLCLQ